MIKLVVPKLGHEAMKETNEQRLERIKSGRRMVGKAVPNKKIYKRDKQNWK